jgi:Ribbon-helix-helix protein, copG family
MTRRIYGHTEAGTPITDGLIGQLADEAQDGYDVDKLIARRGKRGRHSLGSEPSTVGSVRLDPDLKARLVRRAEEEGVPVSEVSRDALRRHLEAT